MPVLCRPLEPAPSTEDSTSALCCQTGRVHRDKRTVRLLRRHSQAMAAVMRLATVDQLLRKAPPELDASGAPDGFNNLGCLISWIKSLNASVSNGLRSILKFEGAAFAASL
jgi:hypothetical protein